MIFPWFGMPSPADDVDDAVIQRSLLVDTPANIVPVLQAAQEAGLEVHLHQACVPGIPIERCGQAPELFAREVIPALSVSATPTG